MNQVHYEVQMTQHDKPPKREAGHVDEGLTRHGHVSYLEIPALDAERSADFYASVFDWNIRRRDNGHPSFDDRSGGLIGRWETGRAVSREPGLLPFIYVDAIDEVVERIVAQGGEMVKPPYPEGDLWVATFRDPAGNLMGIWQSGPR
jgi:predicted enzyme related to lactoylglutathione lyase